LTAFLIGSFCNADVPYTVLSMTAKEEEEPGRWGQVWPPGSRYEEAQGESAQKLCSRWMHSKFEHKMDIVFEWCVVVPLPCLNLQALTFKADKHVGL
jgi:hypothetical protein